MERLVKKELQDFVQPANEVVVFKLIRSAADLEDEEEDSFHPDFTHQVSSRV